MTVQIPELLEYERMWYSLHSLPLEEYLAKFPERPAFYATTTCLERMYIGMWKIEGGCLFLIGLHGHDRKGNSIGLHDLFPERAAPICADWYSGVLRCPQGKRLKTILFGFESVYEADLLLTIARGGLVHVERRINSAPWEEAEAADLPAFLRKPQGPGPS